MAITLWDLQSNLSRKGVATSTEGVTGSNVNYLRSRKSEHLLDLLFKWMKYFCIQFLLLLQHLFVSLFFSCLHFCLLSHVKLLNALWNHWNTTEKRKPEVFFGRPSWYTGPQLAWIRHWYVPGFSHWRFSFKNSI